MTLPAPTDDTPQARLARAVCRGSGWCGRCGWPWQIRKGHVTQYDEHRGCFPLCEDCWADLGHPEARIPYYGALVDAWAAEGFPLADEQRTNLGRAVAAGL